MPRPTIRSSRVATPLSPGALEGAASDRASTEFLRTHSSWELRDQLERDQRIVYTQNGNRSVDAGVLLERLARTLPLVGISRVAEISQLAPHAFPVFQTTRPNLYSHRALGQNSGSQGKGASRDQARISAIMESIEGYAAEPKHCPLVRGSFDFLRPHHVVADPSRLVHRFRVPRARRSEAFMWTPAYWLEKDQECLVPAECVFVPFVPQDYRTRSCFPCSSNGLASGSTYLEAANHALYEVIERLYHACMEAGLAKLEAMYEEDHAGFDIARFNRDVRGELELQLFAVSLFGRGRDLPMVMCWLVGPEEAYGGYGCSGNVDMSISRAISEALQSYATRLSGSREDMAASGGYFPRWFRPSPVPRRRTLRIERYRKRVTDNSFKSLRGEFDFLVDWIHRARYPHILISNLTRVGLEVPVVKVVVPGMPTKLLVRRPPKPRRAGDVQALCYGAS